MKLGHRPTRQIIVCHIVAALTMIAVIIFGSAAAIADGPEPAAEWSKIFGGSNTDEGWYVERTSDGGYIITGYTFSYGGGQADVWLIKTDANGDKQWDRTFGRDGYSVHQTSDYGQSVKQTPDGGYIIVGVTINLWTMNEDVYLIKTYSNGNEQWSRTYGNITDESGYSIVQAPDGGYAIAGYETTRGSGQFNTLLMKTDSNGNEQWSRLFPALGQGRSILESTEGGYIIAGSSSLIKTDYDGNEQWHRSLPGFGYCVQQTTDSGYIVSGSFSPYGSGQDDAWLMKTDSAGNQQWSKTFGGPLHDYAMSVQLTSDGGYILTGASLSYSGADGMRNLWLIKTDMDGNEQWNKVFLSSYESNGFSVEQATDGGYVVVGYTTIHGNWDRDVWLIKVSNPPNQPTNILPANDATSVSLTPTLQSSAFSDPDAGDTHAASQWQVRTSAGSYSSPVYDSSTDSTNLTSVNVLSGRLNYLTTYYWHVRYQDNHSAWSDYSSETFFTTLAPPPNTPVGSNVPVSLPCGTVTFNTVTATGTTTTTTSQGNPGGGIPSGFRVRGLFIDISTTASYTGPITLGISYDPSTPNPQNLKLFHSEGGHWVDVTTSVDTVNHIVYGEVSSFSWFFIGGQWVEVAGAPVPVFPNIYIGIIAALGAGVLAYFVRKRLIYQR